MHATEILRTLDGVTFRARVSGKLCAHPGDSRSHPCALGAFERRVLAESLARGFRGPEIERLAAAYRLRLLPVKVPRDALPAIVDLGVITAADAEAFCNAQAECLERCGARQGPRCPACPAAVA